MDLSQYEGGVRHNGRQTPGRDPQPPLAPAEPVTSDDLEIEAIGMEAVRMFQQAAASPNTRRGYATDLRAFGEWCRLNDVDALPAQPATVARYLAESANLRDDETGEYFYAPGTLKRWLASINKAHHLIDAPTPGAHAEVALTMAGIRRERARREDKKAPLLVADLRRVVGEIDLTSWPRGVIGHRDMALLIIGFAGAYRRSELADIMLGDVFVHADDGLHMLLRHSKTDQDSDGLVKALPYGANPSSCPPCAYARWVRVMAAAKSSRTDVMKLVMAADLSKHICRQPLPERQLLDSSLPLFRPVMKNGAIHERPISGNVVNTVVQLRVADAGLNPAAFGGHSLRAGFVTQAARNGASTVEIMKQTGHRDERTVTGYIRESHPLRGNAVLKVGL